MRYRQQQHPRQSGLSAWPARVWRGVLAGLVLVITDLSSGQADDVDYLHAPHNQHGQNSQHSQIDLIEVAPVPYEPKAQRLNGYAHDYRQELEQNLQQNFGQDLGQDLAREFDQNRAMETEDLALITMNFQDVEIQVLARFISEITHKNFILDDKVRGKVTIISPTQVSPSEAYRVFQSVLQVKGFTTVPNGKVVKIVPLREAKQIGLPTIFNGALDTMGDEFITRLIPLRYVAASEITPILQPMVSPDGLLISYGQTNSLILTDSVPNIRRLLGMLEELDVEGHKRVTEVIPLTHAFAVDLAPKIEAIMKDSGTQPTSVRTTRVKKISVASTSFVPLNGTHQAVQVWPDERTNALIVMARPQELKTVRHLVSQLDVPLPPGTNEIHVYPLKHASVEDLLPLLTDLIGGRSTRDIGGGASQRNRGSRRFEQANRSSRSGSRFDTRRGERGLPAAASRAIQGASGKAAEFHSEVRVTADPTTNSLVISAAPQDFAILKKVIDQLDIPRRQVYVEAIILEVSVDRVRELGIELQGGFSIAGQGIGLGRVSFGALDAALANPASISGPLFAAASNQTIELSDGTTIPARIALLRAAQASQDINVLSAPTILTTDNVEAEIIVGENVPFIASQATKGSQPDNLFTTVQREDVSITLRITPQISEGDHVRLEIYEEVSAIVPTSPDVGSPNEVGPTTSARIARTTVVVKDGQTVVVGGLISDDRISRRDSVPFLSDIPILGHLFRSDQKSTRKVNLLIFLTPHIVRDDTEIAAHSVHERNRFGDFLAQHNAPAKWHKQLNRPSFSPPSAKTQHGVLLPARRGQQ